MKLFLSLFFVFFLFYSFSQPGPSHFTHIYEVIAPDGKVINFGEKNSGSWYEIISIQNDHDVYEQKKKDGKKIIISYSTMYFNKSVKFRIFYNNQQMMVETDIMNLRFPFIPGEFYFSSEYAGIFNPDFSVSNLDWINFKLENIPKDLNLKTLDMKSVFSDQKFRIVDVLKFESKIVAIREDDRNSLHSLLISNDNGQTWKVQVLTISGWQKELYRFSDLILENENILYIICYDKTKNINTISSYDILKSLDGGNSWIKDTLLTALNFSNIHFLKDKTGYALLKEENVGYRLGVKYSISNEWEILDYVLPNALYTLFSDDENTFYISQHIAFYEYYTFHRSEKVFVSKNKGKSWNMFEVKDTSQFNVKNYLFTGIQNTNYYWDKDRFTFTVPHYKVIKGKQSVIVNGANFIYFSRNDGKKWKYIPLNNKKNVKKSIYALHLLFLSDESILINDGNNLFISQTNNL